MTAYLVWYFYKYYFQSYLVFLNGHDLEEKQSFRPMKYLGVMLFLVQSRKNGIVHFAMVPYCSDFQPMFCFILGYCERFPGVQREIIQYHLFKIYIY